MLVKAAKKLITLLPFCFPGFLLSGQNKQADSLLNVLKTAKDDTTKINLLNSLTKAYSLSSDFTSAKKYGEEALRFATAKKWKSGISNSYLALGNVYNAEGLMYHRTGKYTEALEDYFVSLRYREKIPNKLHMAYSYGNIGLIHWQRYNFPEALKYYLISLDLFKQVNNQPGIAGSYVNIGLICVNQKNYEEARKYYEKALNLYQQLGVKDSRLINLYFDIGFLNEEWHRYPEAISSHQAALKICEGLGDKDGIAASLTNIGGATFLRARNETNSVEKQNYLDAALDYQEKSLRIYQELNESESYTNVFVQIAKIYMEQKDFGKARKYLEDAVKYSGEANIYDTKETYDLLTQVDSTTGNWHEAFENHKRLVFYNDSLVNNENSRKIMQAQLQYGFDKKEDSLRFLNNLANEQIKQQTLLAQQHQKDLLLKENELALANKEKTVQQLEIEKANANFAVQKAESDKRQQEVALLNKEKMIQSMDLKKQKQTKNYLITGLALFLALSFFIYNNYKTRQKLRLQTLRNKIASDLHDDVGSTLSSISIFSQMAQENSQEVNPLLQTIGDSSRKMLDAMADIVWTINPDNDQFEKIILRMRSFAYELLGARHIDFRFVADSNVTKMNLSMEARRNLYLIFKEATNNMVKYSNATKAMFSIKGEQGKLVMMIQDNGKGFESDKEMQGNGLKNMKKRASDMGGVLLIDSIPGSGTIVKLELAV